MIRFLRRGLRRLLARWWPRMASWEEWLDDYACCMLDEGEGHEGPCQWLCSWCDGSGRCPDCGGGDDLGCDECDGTGSCLHGCDAGVCTDVTF